MTHLQKSKPPRRAARKATRDWAAIEQDYRAGVKSVAQIAADHEVSKNTITRRARAAGWPSRRDVRRKPSPPAPGRAALMARMRWLLERQIANIERGHGGGSNDGAKTDNAGDDVADDVADDAADRERNARTLGSLIRTLEKLIELERELGKTEAEKPEAHDRQGDRRDSQTSDAPASDANTIRAELARRLARLAAAGPKTEISSKPDPG